MIVGNIPENAIEGVTNGLTKAWYNGYIYTLYINEYTPAPPANAEYLVTRGLTEVYGVKTDFNSIGDFILDSFVTAYYPELQAWVSMYDFGGVPEFKTIFEEFAQERFGSGWVWLILTKGDKLKVMSTPNQDNP